MRSERLSKPEGVAQAIDSIDQLLILRDELRNIFLSFAQPVEAGLFTRKTNKTFALLLGYVEEMGEQRRNSPEFLRLRRITEAVTKDAENDLLKGISEIRKFLFDTEFSSRKWKEKIEKELKEIDNKIMEAFSQLFFVLLRLEPRD